MRHITRITKLLSLFGLLAAGHAVGAAGQAGGTYSMTLDHGKPVALTSLDFGESNAGNGGGPGKFSPVTVTVATGAEAVGSIISTCAENHFFREIHATYKDAQGQLQFEVTFRNVNVSSVTLPAVDKTSTPPADMTWVFTVQSEDVYTPPATGTSAPGKTSLTRVWHTLLQRPSAAPSGKFSLKIHDIDTTGVLTVSPFVITRLAHAVAGGRAKYEPITLTVSVGKATDFTNWLSSRKVVPRGKLAYNRRSDTGQEEAIVLFLMHPSIKSCDFVGNSGAAPYYKVQIGFDEVGASTSSTPVTL